MEVVKKGNFYMYKYSSNQPFSYFLQIQIQIPDFLLSFLPLYLLLLN